MRDNKPVAKHKEAETKDSLIGQKDKSFIFPANHPHVNRSIEEHENFNGQHPV